MNNFEFHNPVKVLFGKGQIAKLGDLIPKGSRVLLTYGGGSILRNGVHAQVKAALAGYDVREFGGIEANPVFETLMKAVEVVKKDAVDFLLAVGGGSVVDGTKFVAAAARYAGDPWDLLAKSAAVKAAVPLGVVLTLPATGSEMNTFAVISRKSTNEKLAFGSPLMYPVFSVVDPESTFSLPQRQVGNGIVDTFAHVLEQYLTFPSTAPLQDRQAEAILLTLIEEGPKTYANPTDYDSRANLCWCATMALNGLISVGVPQDWSTHMIGHELTALFGLDHGQSLAVVFPGTMAIRKDAKRSKLLQFAERVWGIREGSDDQRIGSAIARTRGFFESVGVKTRLKDYGITYEAARKVPARFTERGWTTLGERQDVTPQRVEEILAYSA